MGQESPRWLTDERPAQPAQPQYLTTEMAARPWEAPPPSKFHRYLVRGLIAAALVLLVLVVWSEQAPLSRALGH